MNTMNQKNITFALRMREQRAKTRLNQEEFSQKIGLNKTIVSITQAISASMEEVIENFQRKHGL